MPIVFVSSVPFGGGERLARALAEKMGCAFLSREDVVAKATDAGIPVGKLEVAMIHKPSVRERLARLRDRYLAVATATICERAASGDLVYFGRAGQLLLPGVSHVIRVRVIPEPAQRAASAAQRTKLPAEKVETLLADIDADVRAWVHFVHGVEMDDLRRYDVVINLENMSIENAATALCGIAELPDFRPTPASQRAMQERLLQSQARIRLALDPRTAESDLAVRCNERVVTITYMPRQDAVAAVIPAVLADLPGCRGVRTTVATTNILWIEEQFAPAGRALEQIKELARRWGAAVELLRYRPEEAEPRATVVAASPALAAPVAANGGIEDDVVEEMSAADRGFRETLEILVHAGRSGGGQSVAGSRDRLIATISREIPYSLVVIGDLYLAKGGAVRTRLTRELANFMADHVKAPVIGKEQLGAKLRFGLGGLARLAASLAAMAALYWALFAHQAPILEILGGTYHEAHRYAAVLLVALLAPLAAGLNASLAASVLRLLKLE
jgi:cytidylate kinase